MRRGGAEITVLPDLSRATLQRHAILRPLLGAIKAAGLTYRWGYPFHLVVRKGNTSFAVYDKEDLPSLFEYAGMDPLEVPNWLAPFYLPAVVTGDREPRGAGTAFPADPELPKEKR